MKASVQIPRTRAQSWAWLPRLIISTRRAGQGGTWALPANLNHQASSRFSERLRLNKNKVERHWGKCWTSTSDLHAKTCTHIQPPPYTHTKTYSKWLSWVSRKRLCHLTNIDSPPTPRKTVLFSPCYVKQCSSSTSYSCENIETV